MASASLFDAPQPAFEARLQRFAREVAKRHRGRPADARAMVEALRAYHAAWALFHAVPALDSAALGVAVAAYQAARTGSGRAAA